MRDWPHGVTGTRNEELLAALEVVERERDVRPDEQPAFREGFIAGWQERSVVAKPGTVNITRERFADLERRAGVRHEFTLEPDEVDALRRWTCSCGEWGAWSDRSAEWTRNAWLRHVDRATQTRPEPSGSPVVPRDEH